MIYRQNFTFYQKKTGFALFRSISLAGKAWIMTAIFVLMLVANAYQSAYANDDKTLALKAAAETIFPDDRLMSKDGSGFSIASHEGALIVNFWATWCAPCVHELPELAKAAEILSQDEMPISVVLISVDRKGAEHAQNFLDERDITGVISAYNPTSSWPRALGLSGLPSTYLIGANRQEIYLLHGPADWADKAVIAQVRDVIGRK